MNQSEDEVLAAGLAWVAIVAEELGDPGTDVIASTATEVQPPIPGLKGIEK